jgi:hypothetical protein
VLECLLASGGLVLSAEELLERVWDEHADPFTTAVKTRCTGCAPSSATRPSSTPSARAATGSETHDDRHPQLQTNAASVDPRLRVQLTVLYAGLFVLLVAAVLAVSAACWSGKDRPTAAVKRRHTTLSSATISISDRRSWLDRRADRLGTGLVDRRPVPSTAPRHECCRAGDLRH